MATWKIRFWTDEVRTVQADSLQDAYALFGYEPGDGTHLWDEDGTVTNSDGDFCARIEPLDIEPLKTPVWVAVSDGPSGPQVVAVTLDKRTARLAVEQDARASDVEIASWDGEDPRDADGMLAGYEADLSWKVQESILGWTPDPERI